MAVAMAEKLGGNTLRWSDLAIEPVTPVDVTYRASVDIWGRLPLGPGGVAHLHQRIQASHRGKYQA